MVGGMSGGNQATSASGGAIGVFVSFLPGKVGRFSPEFASKPRERSRHGRVKPRSGPLFDEIGFFSYVGTYKVFYSYAS